MSEPVAELMIRAKRDLDESLEAQLRGLGEERCRRMAAEGWTIVQWTETTATGFQLCARLEPPSLPGIANAAYAVDEIVTLEDARRIASKIANAANPDPGLFREPGGSVIAEEFEKARLMMTLREPETDTPACLCGELLEWQVLPWLGSHWNLVCPTCKRHWGAPA